MRAGGRLGQALAQIEPAHRHRRGRRGTAPPDRVERHEDAPSRICGEARPLLPARRGPRTPARPRQLDGAAWDDCLRGGRPFRTRRLVRPRPLGLPRRRQAPVIERVIRGGRVGRQLHRARALPPRAGPRAPHGRPLRRPGPSPRPDPRQEAWSARPGPPLHGRAVAGPRPHGGLWEARRLALMIQPPGPEAREGGPSVGRALVNRRRRVLRALVVRRRLRGGKLPSAGVPVPGALRALPQDGFHVLVGRPGERGRPGWLRRRTPDRRRRQRALAHASPQQGGQLLHLVTRRAGGARLLLRLLQLREQRVHCPLHPRRAPGTRRRRRAVGRRSDCLGRREDRGPRRPRGHRLLCHGRRRCRRCPGRGRCGLVYRVGPRRRTEPPLGG